MTQIRIHDISTNEIIDRDMTIDEIKIAEALAKESLSAMKKSEDEKIAKQAILERLGLTADEAALLLK